MNEPTRLVDESDSDFEQALLRAGTSYRVAPELRSKTLSALGLAGATALSAGVAGSASLSTAPPAMASTSLLAKLGWFKTLSALATAGAVAAVPAAYFVLRDGPKAESLASSAPAKLAEVRSVPAEIASPELPAQAETAPSTPSTPSTPALKQDRVAAKPASTSAALRAELTALDAARAALSGGNAPGALSLLDGYDRANPRGLLKLEAEVLRIDALAKSGRGDAAKKRAQAFLARHPNSVLASRVRGYTAP